MIWWMRSLPLVASDATWRLGLAEETLSTAICMRLCGSEVMSMAAVRWWLGPHSTSTSSSISSSMHLCSVVALGGHGARALNHNL